MCPWGAVRALCHGWGGGAEGSEPEGRAEEHTGPQSCGSPAHQEPPVCQLPGVLDLKFHGLNQKRCHSRT